MDDDISNTSTETEKSVTDDLEADLWDKSDPEEMDLTNGFVTEENKRYKGCNLFLLLQAIVLTQFS